MDGESRSFLSRGIDEDLSSLSLSSQNYDRPEGRPEDSEACGGMGAPNVPAREEDDDVLFVGSSITVKKEPGATTSARVKDDNEQGAEPLDELEGRPREDEVGSGWLISKKGPKAHFVKGTVLSKRPFRLFDKKTSRGPGSTMSDNEGACRSFRSGPFGNCGNEEASENLRSDCSTISEGTQYADTPSLFRNFGMEGFGRNLNKRRRANELLEYRNLYPMLHRRPGPASPYRGHWPFPSFFAARRGGDLGDIMYGEGGSGRRWNLDPELVNAWIRVLFSLVRRAILLYIVVNVFLIVKRDINNQVQRNVKTVDSESLHCLNEFRRNKCGVVEIPALEQQCKEWEKCMKPDALDYENVSIVSIDMLAGIVRRFLAQLDFKCCVLLFILTAAVSFLIRMYMYYINRVPSPSARPWSGRYKGRELDRYYEPNYVGGVYPYLG